MFELTLVRISFAQNIKSDAEVVCVIKFQGNEIARTEAASAAATWNQRFPLNHFDLIGLETVYNRPFYLEYIELEIIQKGNKILESRVPLTCIDKPFSFYKLLRPEGQESKHDKHHEASYILLGIQCVDTAIREWVPSFDRCELRQVLPEQPNLHFLYASLENRSPSMTYRFGLPGPTCGEQLIDIHKNVEVRFLVRIFMCYVLFLTRVSYM